MSRISPPTEGTPDMPISEEGGTTIRQKKQAKFPILRFWLAALILVGVLAVSLVSFVAASWLKTAQITRKPTIPVPLITTLQIQRTAPYAGLDITVISAQYATFFTDDNVHSGPAIVRLNIRVTNNTKDQIDVVFYDTAHLLIPGKIPIAPTTVHLLVVPQPYASETGWIDFPVPDKTKLDILTLQLGSIALNESMVKIPFKGAFNAQNDRNRVSPQNAVFRYNFNGSLLNYQLNSVEVGYSYRGEQCKAGEQFYVLNFRVGNPNGVDVSPGFGFDYIRLVIDGNTYTPVDNSLPYTFKAGINAVDGHVVFSAPAGMKSLTIGFLSQNGNGERYFSVNIL